MIVVDGARPLQTPCSICGEPLGATVALIEPVHARRAIVVPEALHAVVNHLEIASACVACAASLESDEENAGARAYLAWMRDSGLA
jgi:hypothetical protein